jgi:hypothetical protein
MSLISSLHVKMIVGNICLTSSGKTGIGAADVGVQKFIRVERIPTVNRATRYE